MERIGCEVGIAAILAKSRSFPLISVYLSRALGRDVAVNGGGLGGFGGEIGGFGWPVRGLEERRLGVRMWALGWLGGWRRDGIEAPVKYGKDG